MNLKQNLIAMDLQSIKCQYNIKNAPLVISFAKMYMNVYKEIFGATWWKTVLTDRMSKIARAKITSKFLILREFATDIPIVMIFQTNWVVYHVAMQQTNPNFIAN
jgi:hypothetical protein